MLKFVRSCLLLIALVAFGNVTALAIASGFEETDLSKLDVETTHVSVRNLPVVTVDRSLKATPLGTSYSFENGRQLLKNKGTDDPASYKSTKVFCKVFVRQDYPNATETLKNGTEALDLSKEMFAVESVKIGATTINQNPRVDYFMVNSPSLKLGSLLCSKSVIPPQPVTLEEIRAALGTKVEFQVKP